MKSIAKYINEIKNEKINNNEQKLEDKKNVYFPAFKEIKGYLTQYEKT